MNKYILLSICILIASASFGQQKKATDPMAALKTKTEKWFKEIYVEQSFKDPYSYKLMKCIIAPVSLKDRTEESKRELMYLLSSADTTKSYGEYAERKKMTKYSKDQYDKILIESEGDEKRINLYKKLYEANIYFQKELQSKYQKLVEMDLSLDSTLMHTDKAILEKIYDYTVYIDAYGKNSLGNLVLGKYYYVIDKKGITTSDVKKLD